jgi:hypothetical protein
MILVTSNHRCLRVGYHNLIPRAGPNHCERGLFGPISVAYAILSFHHDHRPTQGLRSIRSRTWDMNPLDDVVRWEARHTSNKEVHAWREGELVWGTAR